MSSEITYGSIADFFAAQAAGGDGFDEKQVAYIDTDNSRKFVFFQKNVIAPGGVDTGVKDYVCAMVGNVLLSNGTAPTSIATSTTSAEDAYNQLVTTNVV